MTTPRTVGRYQVRGVLGSGTMGVVYEGYDATLNRSVAIKTFDLKFAVSERDRSGLEKRFLAEARAAAGLQHPAIVVVYDVGRDPSGGLFMALEHLRGETVEKMLAGGRPLEWRRALELARRVAEGLHHAHRSGIIHRDVKPANIMVLASGEPKIMDFGIAKVSSEHLTAAGQSFGTPSYMSPEQASGMVLDARSDVFSLGAVLYEMLTGRRAFAGSGMASTLVEVIEREPAAPGSLLPGLPEGVDAVVAGALAKHPEGRYPSAESLARDLAAVLEGREPSFRARKPRSGTVVPDREHEPAPGSPRAEAAFETTQASGHLDLALPPGKRVTLAALDGPCRGQVFLVTGAHVTLGRAGGGADIELGDPEVSRAHAALRCEGDRFELQDLGSTNGTLVDGRPIRAREIDNQTEFVVGRSRLMLIVTDVD